MILARPGVQRWGWVIAAFLVGFGVGNFDVTWDAVRGDGKYWQRRCSAIIAKHQEQDYEKYGH